MFRDRELRVLAQRGNYSKQDSKNPPKILRP